MLMPEIATIAAISIIGLPIALILMIAPLLFLLALGSFLIGRWLGGSWPAYIAGFVVAAIVLAVPPFIANKALDNNAERLIAADHHDGTRPETGRVIGLRYASKHGFNRDELACDGLCQRLLLNGVASQVLVVVQGLDATLDPLLIADSFRLEKRSTCSVVKLPRGHDPINIRADNSGGQDKRVDELMQIAIAGGNCLIAEPASLNSADLVVSFGLLKRGATSMSAGLKLMADTIRADRIALHEKRGSNFIETYRWTGVVIEKLYPLYAPTAIMGAELRTVTGLARYTEKRNITEKYYDRPDITAFFVDRLGFDLALRTNSAVAETQSILEKALADRLTVPVPAQVAADFFEGLTQARNMSATERTLTLGLLEDERFPVTMQAWAGIKYAGVAEPDYFNAIAAAMVKRLRAIDSVDTGEKFPKWQDEASYIGGVFRELPRQTILAHRQDLEWLAREERIRVGAYQALIRLAEFGEEGGRTLLWLIDDAERFRNGGGNDWQHPHLAALIGFCKMGPSGKDFIQPLFDRLDRGIIANWSSYHRLVIHALIGLGAPTEKAWLHVKSNNASTDAQERTRFDKEVARATKKPDCYY